MLLFLVIFFGSLLTLIGFLLSDISSFFYDVTREKGEIMGSGR